MKKLNYVLKNTFINMRRNPLLVVATMLAVLVSSFLVFTTLSARAIVENNTSRWQNGVHVVIFLDDRVTSTAHKQLQDTLESYPEVRMVEYFTKSEASDEFKLLFKDQPELLQEVDFDILPTSLRINLNDPADYKLIIERMDGNPAVKEIRASGEAIERLIEFNKYTCFICNNFCCVNCFCSIYFNYQHVKAYSLCKEKRNKNNENYRCFINIYKTSFYF